jgi:large subunit ribosomal protein L15
MAYSLHTLKPSPGSLKRKRRLGRGYGSGRAKTAGRGTKGQRARSGGKSGLKRLGMKQILLQQPKSRGFKSPHKKPESVNVGDLEKHFGPGAVVTVRALHRVGLIPTILNGAKILGRGDLAQAVVVRGVLFSDAARVKIEAAGGKIVARKDEKGRKTEKKAS